MNLKNSPLKIWYPYFNDEATLARLMLSVFRVVFRVVTLLYLGNFLNIITYFLYVLLDDMFLLEDSRRLTQLGGKETYLQEIRILPTANNIYHDYIHFLTENVISTKI